MTNGLKSGEWAALAHVPDGIEVADDRYDQLFEVYRLRATNQLAAVQQSIWQPAGEWMD